MVFAILVFIIISYKIAINKTFELRAEYKKTKKEIEVLSEVPNQIKVLRKKQESYNSSIEKSFSQMPVQVFILDYVAEYCKNNNIIIKDFPKTHVYKNQDYSIETNRILLSGGFNSILRLIYNIEQKYHVGKISSVKFYKAYNNKTKINELFSDIYIQTIRRNE